MNKAFREAVGYYKKELNLNHQQKVTRLYRQSLKLCFSWTGSRELFLEEATKLRQEFRKNASLDANSKYFNFYY